MSSDKDNHGDFINRVNRLLDKDTKPLPQDDELALRFNKVFDAEPIATTKQKPNYNIPKDAADEQLEQYLLEAELLETDPDDDDDNDDYLADILNRPDKETPAQNQHGLKAWQDTFLGKDGLEDGILDDQGQALIDQLKDQVAVESKYAAMEEQRHDALEQRYLALKKEGAGLLQGHTISSDSCPRGRVPAPLAMADLHDEMDDWCCVCNEDATIECQDCDHDRFCRQCFYDGHQSDTADYGFSKHRAKAYTK